MGDDGSGTTAGVPRPSLRFRVVAWVVTGLVRAVRWRVHTVGLEHVPRRGGAVIAWNHHSYVDFLLTAWDIYHRLDRPVRLLAKKEVWDSPWWGWVPRFADAVPVDRRSHAGRAGALSAAVEALQDGHLVLVAPEGTISPSLELMRFASGAARMAGRAGVPLIPSVSWGTHRLAAHGRRPSLREGVGVPIVVRFGAPLRPGPDDDPRAVTRRLRTTMARMLDEVQRTYPDGTPDGAWWVPARLGGGAPEPGGRIERLAARRRAGREREAPDEEPASDRRAS